MGTRDHPQPWPNNSGRHDVKVCTLYSVPVVQSTSKSVATKRSAKGRLVVLSQVG